MRFPNAAVRDTAQGVGKYMRHVKLKPGAAVNASPLQALIAVAYLDIKTRLRAA
jgi:hypothetical protein